MSAGFTCIFPEGFGGIELRRMSGQICCIKPTIVRFKPLLHTLVSMVGSIIVNVVNRLRVITVSQLVQEVQIVLGIENIVSMIVKSGLEEFNGAEHFDTLALTGDRDQGLATSTGPGRVQGGILAEGNLVCKDQRGVLAFGFFLSSDRCSAANAFEPRDRHGPVRAWVVEGKSPICLTICGHDGGRTERRIPP